MKSKSSLKKTSNKRKMSSFYDFTSFLNYILQNNF